MSSVEAPCPLHHHSTDKVFSDQKTSYGIQQRKKVDLFPLNM